MTTAIDRVLEQMGEGSPERKFFRGAARKIRAKQFHVTGDVRDICLTFDDGEIKMKPDGTWSFKEIIHKD